MFGEILRLSSLLIALLFNRTNTTLQKNLGISTKNILENCSPTFIKFGQLVSHRPDIFPKIFCDQLLSLTDNTQPASLAQIKIKIHNSVQNKDFEILQIDPSPLGSASIVQVHRVLVKYSDNGLERWGGLENPKRRDSESF